METGRMPKTMIHCPYCNTYNEEKEDYLPVVDERSAFECERCGLVFWATLIITPRYISEPLTPDELWPGDDRNILQEKESEIT
jgi:uncharacterized C2H2 Zn-finger protein